MYEEFYGFGQSPFSLAPDPRFLYLSESITQLPFVPWKIGAAASIVGEPT